MLYQVILYKQQLLLSLLSYMYRVVLEEFQLPQDGGGNCSSASFSIISMSAIGEEEVARTGLLCGDKKGLESKTIIIMRR